MGLGMQIVYVGLPASAAVEAQAGLQLLRLIRFSAMPPECRLVVESLSSSQQSPTYRARLELMSSERAPGCTHQCESDDLSAAVRAVFEAVERELASRAGRAASGDAWPRAAAGKR
ncbi:MAG TPA: hypothetical protein VF445_09310 [Bordetella sp.]|uniref:hypothetical protein n=1 Tax=Bordetella sp. TaxID=28081 RepID=UPI002ED305C6